MRTFRLLAACQLTTLAAFAAPIPSEQLNFFEAKIRPVLVNHCYECHSADANKSKGGLLLDTRENIRTGGDRGPAVVPGNPVKSLLLTAISHTDPDLQMPPKKAPLPKSVIGDFEAWIKMGAPDPREPTGKAIERPPVDIKSGREFWSYKKPVRDSLPAAKNPSWVKRDLDHFILAKLEESQLKPSPDAEPVTLLRRLYFDLIGLPPSQDAAVAFTKRAQAGELDAALLAEVDTLLKSPHFGERWGRHWMDVARFAESNGRESNIAYPHAWRYRDYVIGAFNADRPFDRFITEQLAGDLLPAKDDAERARLLIATGFLAFGAKGLNEMNRAQFEADLADEQIDAVTRAVMASSVACARCHDHKYDPFAMEDYYALAGIFGSTKTYFGTWIDSENNVGGELIRLPDLPGQLIPNKPMPEAKVKQLKTQLAKLDQEEKDGAARVKKAVAEGKDLSGEGYDMLRNAIRIYWTRGGIKGQLATVDDTGRALPLCMGVQEKGKVKDARLLERGEIARPIKPITRGYPRVIEVSHAKPPPREQSGRLELAQWLTSPDHPLTARVMANRVWHHLFGVGLVRTVDNFGFTGERPSHPELLDHLALRFVDGGWSVKSLVREIVLSRAYRQASTYRADCFNKDPENRLLWRANKRRLDAEVIRDSMLTVSGRLDRTPRKGSLVTEMNHSMSLVGFNKAIPADLDGSRHRSVYLPVIRDRLPDALDIFDFAEPSLVSGDREVTNVPVQALYLMNSPFVQEQAAALAQRVAKEAATPRERIRRAFALCFNRAPDAAELKLADAYFEAANVKTEGPEPDVEKIWAGYCQALLASAEFRNVD
ncbi:MAG: PSD1 and planctomycete cytochrome C domain-containing protein [Verrucomicrobiota bacterium]